MEEVVMAEIRLGAAALVAVATHPPSRLRAGRVTLIAASRARRSRGVRGRLQFGNDR